MKERLRQAAQEGLVLAVKWGVASAVLIVLALLLAQDYLAVRVGAQQGAAAFTFIQQQLVAQSKAKPAP